MNYEEMLVSRISEAVRSCGQVMLGAGDVRDSVEEKEGHGNFVTYYDKKVQDMLFSAFGEILPEARFMGEETTEVDYLGQEGGDTVLSYMPDYQEGLVFIVDPIDGTTNFIKGYRCSAISVALLKEGQPYIAVVYNPYQDEMFTAIKGQGTRVNGKPVRVSENTLKNGIAVFGTALYYPGSAKPTFETAYKYFTRSLDVRRSGSAAVDLCTIAAGRAELFFELQLQPWDYAAGGLLVTEAGGTITTMEHTEITYDRPCSILAYGSGVLRSEL